MSVGQRVHLLDVGRQVGFKLHVLQPPELTAIHPDPFGGRESQNADHANAFMVLIWDETAQSHTSPTNVIRSSRGIPDGSITLPFLLLKLSFRLVGQLLHSLAERLHWVVLRFSRRGELGVATTHVGAITHVNLHFAGRD